MQNSIQEHEQITETKGGGDARDDIHTISPPNEQQFWHKMLLTLLITSPVLALNALGCANFNQLTDQLVYIKYGGQLGNTSELNGTCTASLNKTGEDQAQTSTSEFRLYSRMGRCAAAFIFLPFWGSHTDRSGRHVAVIVGSVSALMYNIPLLLVALTDVVPLWILILGDVLHGAFGNSSHLIILACASFTADVFPQGHRILMMICVDLVFLLAYTVGQVGGGYWIELSGFVPIVISMVVIHIIVLLYGILLFRKLAQPHYQHRPLTDDTTSKTSTTVQYFIRTYKTISKKRDGYARAYFLLTVLVVFIMHFSTYGISSIFNIYVIGPPLCWNSVFLGIFNGVGSAANAVFPVLLGIIFMKSSGQTTAWLVLAGLTSELIRAVMYGFVSTNLLMYVSTLLGSLAVLVTPASRTIIADLVNADEQGAAIAGYTLSTVLAEFLANPLFNAVFVTTLSSFKTCVFFVAAGFDVIALLILGVYGCIKLRDKGVQYQPLVTAEVR